MSILAEGTARAARGATLGLAAVAPRSVVPLPVASLPVVPLPVASLPVVSLPPGEPAVVGRASAAATQRPLSGPLAVCTRQRETELLLADCRWASGP